MDIEVGPLFNNQQASQKAEVFEQQNPDWKWVGAWVTTVPNKMSVLRCVRKVDYDRVMKKKDQGRYDLQQQSESPIEDAEGEFQEFEEIDYEKYLEERKKISSSHQEWKQAVRNAVILWGGRCSFSQFYSK